jgi:hypothetical protein
VRAFRTAEEVEKNRKIDKEREREREREREKRCKAVKEWLLVFYGQFIKRKA